MKLKLAIMQPYFFPYLGYFNLIKSSDQFIIFDTVQYARKSWMNRNRILHPVEGTSFIVAPTHKAPLNTKINEIKINNSENWKERIFNQLKQYKKVAPYYQNVVNLLNEIFKKDIDNLSQLNTFILMRICEYLEINCNIKVFSDMDLKIEEVTAADEWALNISKSLGAQTYINAPGGVDFFDKVKYEKNGISLKFIKSNLPQYNQGGREFVSGLSILDVMMFNSKKEIHVMLEDCEIL